MEKIKIKNFYNGLGLPSGNFHHSDFIIDNNGKEVIFSCIIPYNLTTKEKREYAISMFKNNNKELA